MTALRTYLVGGTAFRRIGTPDKPCEFEAVMHLLAMFNTQPLFALNFCRELDQAAKEVSQQRAAHSPREDSESDAFSTPLATVVGRLSSNGGTSEAESRLRTMIDTYLQRFEGSDTQPTIDPYCRWHPVVSRYSFVGESSREAPTSH